MKQRIFTKKMTSYVVMALAFGLTASVNASSPYTMTPVTVSDGTTTYGVNLLNALNLNGNFQAVGAVSEPSVDVGSLAISKPIYVSYVTGTGPVADILKDINGNETLLGAATGVSEHGVIVGNTSTDINTTAMCCWATPTDTPFWLTYAPSIASNHPFKEANPIISSNANETAGNVTGVVVGTSARVGVLEYDFINEQTLFNGSTLGAALGISADGHIVVGQTPDRTAFCYNALTGINQDLQVDEYVTSVATGVSSDGLTIVGSGTIKGIKYPLYWQYDTTTQKYGIGQSISLTSLPTHTDAEFTCISPLGSLGYLLGGQYTVSNTPNEEVLNAFVFSLNTGNIVEVGSYNNGTSTIPMATVLSIDETGCNAWCTDVLGTGYFANASTPPFTSTDSTEEAYITFKKTAKTNTDDGSLSR